MFKLVPLLLLLLLSGISAAAHAATQQPGPSQELYQNPYYSCSRIYYVAPGGTDTNPGSQANPWKTLQGANGNLRSLGSTAAGVCVYVEPGTYDGVQLSIGGTTASASGYLTFRCTALDACIIKGDAGYHGGEAFETVWPSVGGIPPNYIQIDGFVMTGGDNNENADGVLITNGDNGTEIGSHHIWVLNSKISGFGQSGAAIAATEYVYMIHNRVFGNSHLNCGAQGSGLAFNIMHAIPNYTPTQDDLVNPNKLLGPTWVIGSSFFHIVASWNIVYNNALTGCGTQNNPTDTDGNGIIFDTNLENYVGGVNQGNTQNYLSPSLVAFNVVYNNGGGGLHFYLSANATVANNSCFNNYIDPGDNGSSRPCIDDQQGFGVSFLSNIAVAVPASHNGTCFPVTPPFTGYNFAMLGAPTVAGSDVFSNNITHIVGMNCTGVENAVYNGDVFTCQPGPAPANQCATDPGWAAVGNQSAGTETTPPKGANFALKAGSPAIGKGLAESYLPANAIDAGACASGLTTCH